MKSQKVLQVERLLLCNVFLLNVRNLLAFRDSKSVFLQFEVSLAICFSE